MPKAFVIHITACFEFFHVIKSKLTTVCQKINTEPAIRNKTNGCSKTYMQNTDFSSLSSDTLL